METRSKSLRGATGPDAEGLGAAGEVETRPTCDSPSPPKLTLVETWVMAVHHDVEADMGQHHEPSDAPPRPGISTNV